MSRLHEAIDDYLTIRRSLGYRLERHGSLLPDFADYLEQAGATTITIEEALAWATLPEGQPANWCAERLSTVRGFAAWLAATDPTVEVPPTDLLPWRPGGPCHTCSRPTRSRRWWQPALRSARLGEP